MRSANKIRRQPPGAETPPSMGTVKGKSPSSCQEEGQTASYVRLLLITLIAVCTAIYLVVPWHHTEAQCASAYLYTVDCAPGPVLGEYVLE